MIITTGATMRAVFLLLVALASCHAAPSIRYHSEIMMIVMTMIKIMSECFRVIWTLPGSWWYCFVSSDRSSLRHMSKKTQKCHFFKIPQWPTFEILGDECTHQYLPKKPLSTVGEFFVAWTTFRHHVNSRLTICLLTHRGKVLSNKRG